MTCHYVELACSVYAQVGLVDLRQQLAIQKVDVLPVVTLACILVISAAVCPSGHTPGLYSGMEAEE